MAKSLNRVELLGHVGRSPEIKATAGGHTVATFAIATAQRVKGKDGNWQEYTEWHNLVAFGRLAEIIRDYVGKGSKLYVEGRLQTRSWDDKDTGRKQYRTEIILSDVTLLTATNKQATPVDGSTVQGYAYEHCERDAQITDDDAPF